MTDLPPLPEPHWRWETEPADAYTTDQMREYALASIALEREACAKVCEDSGSNLELHKFSRKAALTCAAAIRAR